MVGAIIGELDGYRYLEHGCRLGFPRFGEGNENQCVPKVSLPERSVFLMKAAEWSLKIRCGGSQTLSAETGRGLIPGIAIGYIIRSEMEIPTYLRHVARDEHASSVENLARAVFRARRHEEKETILAGGEGDLFGVEAFVQTDSFTDALTTAFSLGEDAPLDGMVCGAVAGAYYGIVPEMRSGVLSMLDPSAQDTMLAFERACGFG